MGFNHRIRPLLGLLALLVSFILCSPVFSYDNPDLLPEEATPIIDLAKTLNDNQRVELEKSLNDYEEETGWKIRVLSQYDRTPGLAVRKFWDLDERSLLVIADPRGGNLLNFNVGDALYALMPRTFWVELQTRYGNQYYVKDNGEDGAILGAISSVEGCLNKGGCQVVPGLPREQWLFTLTTSILGGFIAGFAAFPRREGDIIAWPWLLLLSPLWAMLFGVFGIAPVISRTTDLLPLVRNSLGFISALITAYLFAQETIGKNLNSNSDI
ncbi:TPM domain-containing protein [Prochlorococcus sp. MIT 1307]|uniref:TPM domain-containing protein n=1 Tax=Prochlorococcus sp. MIT 1307 TaxID=3096219 RepID=UPI002A75AEB2|nr:TPM domain-containing protein [Prochlorococcus sp. MIT 1307]